MKNRTPISKPMRDRLHKELMWFPNWYWYSACPICAAQSTSSIDDAVLFRLLHYTDEKHPRHRRGGDYTVPIQIKRFRQRGLVAACRSCGLEMSITYSSLIKALERVAAGTDKFGYAVGRLQKEDDPRGSKDCAEALISLLRQIAPPETRGGAGGTDSAFLRQLREEAKNLPRPKRPGPPT